MAPQTTMILENEANITKRGKVYGVRPKVINSRDHIPYTVNPEPSYYPQLD